MTEHRHHPTVEILERQVQGLTTLLTLQEETRQAESQAQLAFIMVNGTLRLTFYAQAVLWHWSPTGKVIVAAVSGAPRFDTNAPQIVWYRRAITHQRKVQGFDRIQDLALSQLPEELSREGKTWIHAHGLWLPLNHPRTGRNLGGLWLTRDRQWDEGEKILLEHLLQGYSASMALWSAGGSIWLSLLKGLRRGGWAMMMLMALMATFFIQVRQSALAPARVAAIQPTMVTSPMDGMVSQFYVAPHATVTTGDLLFSLDDTELKSRHQLAVEELALAQTQLRKVGQLAFSDKERMAEIASQKSLVREATAKVEYATALLERSRVRATTAGVAVFSDPYAWLGRPVRLGERVLEIAAPDRVEVAIDLPVAEAMPFVVGAEVLFYLDVDPLQPLVGHLYFAAYDAVPAADGKLVYLLKAELAPGTKTPRLGLKGTAKVYGDEVTLFHALFHRPLASLRRLVIL
ncbi:MAG: HlyD family efflux transporter periplasmic adaptor subunit [Magnetococcales bacterium]|nr:HlyD family efflux transporter periplasmic adaptor subunit [Magnetococcales bacterium]